ncbi:MAG TPA: hypothetical protein EYN89_00885 [Flavobacteriales bacterium]|nr:hypothetical protein [Flavobacteriales bacterium]
MFAKKLATLSEFLYKKKLYEAAQQVREIIASKGDPDFNIKYKKPKLPPGMRRWIAEKILHINISNIAKDQQNYHVWSRVSDHWGGLGHNEKINLMMEFDPNLNIDEYRPRATIINDSAEHLSGFDGVSPKLNDDGTITLYHRTSIDSAKKIVEVGFQRGAENTGDVYFSTSSDEQAVGYGDAIIKINVNPSIAVLNDAFPDGEVHVTIHPNKLMGISAEMVSLKEEEASQEDAFLGETEQLSLFD